jgi:hypothetical protein
MKLFNESIKKTLLNFDEVVTSEKEALQFYEFHQDQFIQQEETWTFAQTKRNIALFNKLVEKIQNRFDI